MKRKAESDWAAKYRDPRWQKMRLQIMERDGFACRHCGKSEGVTLNVHHSYYEAGRNPWEYEEDTLVTWCEECHKKRHEAAKWMARDMANMTREEINGVIDTLRHYKGFFKVMFENRESHFPESALCMAVRVLGSAFDAGVIEGTQL